MNNTKYFTLGNITGETLNLYFNNFLLLCLPYLLVSFPLNLLIEFLKLNYLSLEYSTIVNSGLSILGFCLNQIIHFLVIILAVNAYKENNEKLSTSLKIVRKKWFPFLLMSLLLSLGVIGGIILLIVPGIIFAAAWSVAAVVFFIEGKKITESLSRSWEMTKGFRWIIFVIYFILFLLMLLFFIIYIGFMNIGDIGGNSIMSILMNISANPLSPSNIIYSFLKNLLLPIYTTLSVVIYFNIKKEKEGYDTESMASSFLE